MKILRKILFVINVCLNGVALSTEIESLITFAQQLNKLSLHKPSAVVRDRATINTYEELLEAVNAGSIAQDADKSVVDALFNRVLTDLDTRYNAIKDPKVSLELAKIARQLQHTDKKDLTDTYIAWQKQSNAAKTSLGQFHKKCIEFAQILTSLQKLHIKIPLSKAANIAFVKWQNHFDQWFTPPVA